MKIRTVFAIASTLFILMSAVGTVPAAAASGVTVQVPNGGTTSISAGDFSPSGTADVTQAEFPGQQDNADGSAGPYPGTIVDRSLSNGSGNGVSVQSGQRAKSNPTFVTGFQGLNHYQQRYSRGGNQFSVEPPDQGLCVGNGFELEAVNDVLNVFDSSGKSVLPDNTATNIVAGFPRNVNHAVDLNSFYGYAPAINRSTGIRGEFVTDPSCLFDAQTQRFFVVVLTLDPGVRFQGAFSGVNHLDLAVSQTPDPTGSWNIYRVDVTSDGANAGGVNPCPCLGDYPHIGADANGVYLTTNSYPWATNGFDGAQIYAFDKAQLAAGASSVTMVHLDTFGAVNAPSDAGSTQPGFTVWPAQSPPNQFNNDNGGTEFFLSSNAADEATHPVSGTAGSRNSNQLVQWTLTNTSSLDTSPALSLSTRIVNVEQYAVPPQQKQPGSGAVPGTDVPQGFCLNDETTLLFNGQSGCYRLLVSTTAHNATKPEVVSRIDSNDTRMQQVMYANGRLWASLDTALNPESGPQRAGIAWFIVNPGSGKPTMQGYLGATGYDFTYPAIGVTQSGRGVMAFTATGDSTFPSAAYAPIDAVVGVGHWNVVPGGQGARADDGFTGYKAQRFPNPIRPRWGDYGAAAVDGNSVWIASEYIGSTCDYVAWGGPFFAGGTGDNLLGTCGGASHGPGDRSALANWSTFISQFTP